MKKNLSYIDSQFKMIMDVPKQLYDDTDKWLKMAKVKLDNFTKNSHDPNYIAFEMLENKPGKGLSQG